VSWGKMYALYRPDKTLEYMGTSEDPAVSSDGRSGESVDMTCPKGNSACPLDDLELFHLISYFEFLNFQRKYLSC
jgi:hypothetical protein